MDTSSFSFRPWNLATDGAPRKGTTRFEAFRSLPTTLETLSGQVGDSSSPPLVDAAPSTATTGLDTLRVDGNAGMTIVTDPATGRIRAILRDRNRALPAALGDTRGLEVVTTHGIVDSVRLGR